MGLINLHMTENEPNQKDNANLSAIGKFTGIAFQMIAVIGIFTYAGYKIDQLEHHSTKWLTVLLSLIGVVVSFYIVLKSLKN